jgi:hypothetical protein
MVEEFEERVRALEAELHDLAAADADLERDAEVAERTRIERSRISLVDRLRGGAGAVDVVVVGGAHRRGQVSDVGDGWGVLTDPLDAAAQHLVRLDAVVSVRRLGRAAPTRDSVLPATSLASVLRTWCRDRAAVRIALVDGSHVGGRADAAYADHLDVVDLSGETVSVPFTALAIVTR